MDLDNQPPRQCILHEKMLKEIHMAVCGNEVLGVDGLVKDVRSLKRWRSKIELRVAVVVGGVIAAWYFVKPLLQKIL
jgi:hypothetical protein